jgi:hypothetical protein
MAKRTKENSSLLISYLTLRNLIGWLGILLPLVLVPGLCILSRGDCAMLPSISQYYYTQMGSYFTGTLIAFAVFLFTYKGYDDKDNWFCIAAGVFALGVVFFPMHIKDALGCTTCIVRCTTGTDGIANIHFASAALFLLTLAYISAFQFTQHGATLTSRKKIRNAIYRACAIVIVISLLIIAVYCIITSKDTEPSDCKLIFIFETTSLWAFGISWLVKGETLFKDKKQP